MRMFSFHACRGGRRLEKLSIWSHLEKTGSQKETSPELHMCGEFLSHTCCHVDIHLWGNQKGSDVLSTIGKAGNDHWAELRQSCMRAWDEFCCLSRERGMYAAWVDG
jgi:hypothetical protein